MSINRATWLRALRSSKPLLAAFAAGWAFGVFGPRIVAGVLEARELARADDYWEKRVARVGYEDAEPGDVVKWCVDRSYGSDLSYLAGKPSQPLLWTNLAQVPQGSPTTGGRCNVVLARVVEREPLGLKLTFLAQP